MSWTCESLIQEFDYFWKITRKSHLPPRFGYLYKPIYVYIYFFKFNSLLISPSRNFEKFDEFQIRFITEKIELHTGMDVGYSLVKGVEINFVFGWFETNGVFSRVEGSSVRKPVWGEGEGRAKNWGLKNLGWLVDGEFEPFSTVLRARLISENTVYVSRDNTLVLCSSVVFWGGNVSFRNFGAEGPDENFPKS